MRHLIPSLALLLGCAQPQSSPTPDAPKPRMAMAAAYALLLNGQASAASTTISVTLATAAPGGSPNFAIQIDSEQLFVTGISGSVWTVTRAYASTTAAVHLNGASVTILSGPIGGGGTAATPDAGSVYQILPTDAVVRLNTDAGLVSVSLPAPSGPGEAHTACWLGWGSGLIPPVVNAAAVDGGALMMPFAGLASSAPGGLTTWTAETTPGACATWKWDGTEWVIQ